MAQTKVINRPYEHRQYYVVGHEDIQFFRRLRQCEACNLEFETAEVDKALLDRLVAFREGTTGISKQIGALIRVKTSMEARSDVLNSVEVGKVIDWLVALKSKKNLRKH